MSGRWFSFLLFAVAAGFAFAGLTVDRPAIAMIVAVPVLGLVAWQIVMDHRAGAADAATDVGRGPLPASAWVLAAPVCVGILGFGAGVALYLFAWLRFGAAVGTARSVLIGVVSAAALSWMVETGLGVPLYDGWLWWR